MTMEPTATGPHASRAPSGRPFLTARWEHLLLLNFVCPESLLEPLVPGGTALDRWKGEALVSLVGFMFRDTRVRGLAVPCHRTFEEVNLRFYVRRTVDGEARRGVVFIRELVPRLAIAAVARRVYNEPYLRVSMSHTIEETESGLAVGYAWEHRGGRFGINAEAGGPPDELEAGSEAEFITEHYWGYTRQKDGGTLEYRVDHPRWQVWTPTTAGAHGPFEELYGRDFSRVLAAEPRSAFLALGSPVEVYGGRRLVGT